MQYNELQIARDPNTSSIILDSIAFSFPDQPDYQVCEALFLNDALSSEALAFLLNQSLPEHLQILAAQHPNLPLTNQNKFLLSSARARSALLDRNDLNTQILSTLCIDPDTEVREKAHNKFKEH